MDNAAQTAQIASGEIRRGRDIFFRRRIICDFDGTITPFDVTDALLERFAAPEWKHIEQEWLDGGIGAARCMELQIGLLSVSPRELDAFLDSVPITAGFGEFTAFCRERGLRLSVVSDGLDYAIKRILRRNGLDDLPVIANRLRYPPGADANSPTAFSLSFPYRAEGCPAGVCKCRAAEGEDFLLIGDGRSDCCAAGPASFILARKGGALERRCLEQGYRYGAFTDFFDIMQSDALFYKE